MQEKRAQSAINTKWYATTSAKSVAGVAAVFGDWAVVAGYESVESYTIRKSATTDVLSGIIDKALALAG